ncbi:MAG: hypothetical protein RL168_660 [Bacteroidota bacterium]|jgi:membrane protease YdiL (CAAX protease family)
MKQREVLTLLLAILAGTLLAGLFAPKALQFFGYSGMTIEEIVARPEAPAGRALLLGQGLYTLFMFALPGLYLLQRWREKPLVPALSKGHWNWVDSVLAWAILPLSLPFLSWATEIWSTLAADWAWMAPHFEAAKASDRAVEKMLFFPSLGDQVLSFCTFVFVAALSEEILFRGAVQRLLHDRTTPLAAILGASVAFALGHMNFVQWPFLLGAGLLLGGLYWISGRLWVTMAAHVLHNGLTYYWSIQAGPDQYGQLEVDLPGWGILIATLMAIGVGMVLVKRRGQLGQRV